MTDGHDRPGALAGAAGPKSKEAERSQDTATARRRQAAALARRFGIAPVLARAIAPLAFGGGAR